MSNFDLQEYVREMNNEIFLSENQLNGLYIMLLLRLPSQWDHILPGQENKDKMATVINDRMVQVDSQLSLLLRAYEQKIKNSQISKIEKFMGIFRAKHKSMYIHIQKPPHYQPHHCCEETQNQKQEEKLNPDTELMGVFYGISNVAALSGLGFGAVSDFNSSQRYITFKMGNRYNLTIKNDDPISRDTTSQVFVHNIMPFFGAYDLFGLRAVCKQWQGYVKDAWHNSFKREMYSQLLASELCKDIQFYYKLLQLRNPFYQKLVLLIHALIELIHWESLDEAIQNNALPLSMKRILLVMLLLLGHKLPIPNLNAITDSVWDTHKELALNLKQKITGYFANLVNTVLSINQLKAIKTNFLDNPFMRIQQLNGDDKTPLLLFIFMKQFTFQSIIKNHIILTQEYLGLAKNKLDQLYKGWPTNQRFLEGAYKVLLLRGRESQSFDLVDEKTNPPDFPALLKSVLENSAQEYQTPDFVIKSKSTVTNVYLDKRTKWDIILSTLKKTEESEEKKQKQIGQAAALQSEQSNSTQASTLDCQPPANAVEEQQNVLHPSLENLIQLQCDEKPQVEQGKRDNNVPHQG